MSIGIHRSRNCIAEPNDPRANEETVALSGRRTNQNAYLKAGSSTEISQNVQRDLTIKFDKNRLSNSSKKCLSTEICRTTQQSADFPPDIFKCLFHWYFQICLILFN